MIHHRQDDVLADTLHTRPDLHHIGHIQILYILNKRNKNVMIHDTNVMIHDTNVMIHNTNVMIHDTNVMIHDTKCYDTCTNMTISLSDLTCAAESVILLKKRSGTF